ncbi:MAG: mucoidy inhibitor MuiA family protein [Phycisphaera sp.]|nr:mucoidy inhibitor MuiA family protein [Phycisphaera sp.]
MGLTYAAPMPSNTPALLVAAVLAASSSSASILAAVPHPRSEPTHASPLIAAHLDDTLAPVPSRVDLPISSVTLYRGRAAVTRSGDAALAQGLHELRVGPLPEYADLDSVQARIGDGGRLLDVKTETVARPAPTTDNPRIREALAAVEEARLALAEIDRRLTNNAASTKLVDSIAAKAAADASQAIGGALDPEKLRAQIAFIESERERLTKSAAELAVARVKAVGELEARQRALADAGGAPPIERFAVVTVAVPEGGEVPVSVTYLVANATWEPAYTVRGDLDGGSLAIEFDALIRQATGEDWTDAAVVLSTAQPTRAANPRMVAPAYLELLDPSKPKLPPPPPSAGLRPGGAVAEMAMAPGAPMADAAGSGSNEFGARAKALETLSADASVGGGGAAVEYRIPRTITAASDASAERRTRVATIDAKPNFTLVAQPLVDADVYLRARFVNESPYILLAGRARMYLGSDSIGSAAIGEIPVGGELDLWFGKEPRVTAKRELVSKKASESGVFSKSKGLDREYRISLVNTLPRAVDIEVWDRVPVSRDEGAKVELRDLSPALATDERFTQDSKPQGLLKWTLSLPARNDGADATPTLIRWKTRTTWPEAMTLVGDAD